MGSDERFPLTVTLKFHNIEGVRVKPSLPSLETIQQSPSTGLPEPTLTDSGPGQQPALEAIRLSLQGSLIST